MRAAFNKDTENQYKYSSPHAPFKHASLAWSSTLVVARGGERKRHKERVQRLVQEWFGVILKRSRLAE